MNQAAPFLCDLRDLLFQNLWFEKINLLSKLKRTPMIEQKIAEVAKGGVTGRNVIRTVCCNLK